MPVTIEWSPATHRDSVVGVWSTNRMLANVTTGASEFHLTAVEVGVVSALAAVTAAGFSAATFFRHRSHCEWRLTHVEREVYLLTVAERDGHHVRITTHPPDGLQGGALAIPRFRVGDQERYIVNPFEPVTITVTWKCHPWSVRSRSQRLVPNPRP